jgi:hypothetical protein
MPDALPAYRDQALKLTAGSSPKTAAPPVWFDTAETAYKTALEMCGSLFEQGVRSKVYELPAAA